MDKTQDTTQQEFVGSTDVPKQSFPDKLRRSCVRFWWLYFLIFAALVLVIVLPMYDSADLWMKWKTKAADTTDSVYVGYPTLAQKTINRSAITLNSYAIRHPTPSSFDLGIDYTILSNSSNHANLDSYNASLYLPASETSLVTFEVPAVKSGKATDVSIDQNFTINHPEEFVKFCMVALGSDTYDLNVRGKGGLKLGILPRTSVKYNKTVQSKGLNKLMGFNITRFSLLQDTGPFNANAGGQVMIPNPSEITMDAGNVTATMRVADTLIGNVTLPDLTLKPGNETYTMYATTNQTAVGGLLQQSAYRCGVLPLDVTPDQSVYDGQVIPYLTTALRAATLRVDLDVGPALAEAGFGALIPDDCK